MADEHITVSIGPKAKAGRVVLHEQSDMHPDGEAYIAAPAEGEEAKSFSVGRTPAVEQHIRTGELVEGGGAASARAKAKAEDTEPAEAEPAKPEQRGRT